MVTNPRLFQHPASGLVHIRLMSDLVYVGACAEDAFIEKGVNQERIVRRLKLGRNRAQFYLPTQVLNGADLWAVLEKNINNLVVFVENVIDGPVKEASKRLQKVLSYWKRNRHEFDIAKVGWDDLHVFYDKSVSLMAKVVSSRDRGVEVRIPGGYKGWIPSSRIDPVRHKSLRRGDVIECRVLNWDNSRQSLLLDGTEN